MLALLRHRNDVVHMPLTIDRIVTNPTGVFSTFKDDLTSNDSALRVVAVVYAISPDAATRRTVVRLVFSAVRCLAEVALITMPVAPRLEPVFSDNQFRTTVTAPMRVQGTTGEVPVLQRLPLHQGARSRGSHR
jgi:hypothetical protein